MLRPRPGICALLLAAMLPAAHAVPDADGVIGAPVPDLSEDAAMNARLNYNLGFEAFEKTQRLEAEKAPAAAVQQGYVAARERFRKAVAADPGMKEAWNLLGYTSRRLGDYADSLAAYEAALKLQPDYPEAIEYRAELFLLTGRLDEAKSAYGRLLELSPSYAGVLLQSMRDWLAAPATRTVGSERRAAFAAWVATQP